MQGASETVKTICSIVAGPIMSLVFGYGIRADRKVKFPGLVFVFASALLVSICSHPFRRARLQPKWHLLLPWPMHDMLDTSLIPTMGDGCGV